MSARIDHPLPVSRPTGPPSRTRSREVTRPCFVYRAGLAYSFAQLIASERARREGFKATVGVR